MYMYKPWISFVQLIFFNLPVLHFFLQFLDSDTIGEYVSSIESAKEEEAEKKRQKKPSTVTI